MDRREYMREKKREQRARDKIKAEEERTRTFAESFVEFKNQLRKEALDEKSPAAVKGIYKELLKLEQSMGGEKVISGDEIAKIHLEAERQLREEGYLE